MTFNPVYSLFNTVKLVLQRKIHFSHDLVGSNIFMDDGQEFTIFREVKIDKKSTEENRKQKPAVFMVRFRLSGMNVENNKRFSWLPVPFFIGLPGFRSKLWTINHQNSYFQGIYQWDNEEYARKYSQSFAYSFMSRRSVKGSVSFKVIPNITLKDYLESL